MSWYRTGTVAVTNGSKTVTGVGTLWTTAVNVGDAFALVDANLNPTGAWYEVDAVVSNTEITLKQSYDGTTGSNKQYCVFNLVGNMTTPSFAQRLATFFASFQSLIDKPTTTPTAASIPVADANGDIDSGWLKDATASVKGVVELATPEEVMAGVDDERAVTPAGFKAAFGEFYPTGVTPTYVDSSHFTVSGDLTAIFTKGRVLKITDTGGTFNAVCVSSSYDSGTELTTVTVAGDTLDSGLSAVLYAVQQVTGQIWESGSNANGNYVKFSDGMMICYSPLGLLQGYTNNASGELYTDTSRSWTYPAPFPYEPAVFGSERGANGVRWCTCSSESAINNMYTKGRYILMSSVESTSISTAVLSAIGRWYQ